MARELHQPHDNLFRKVFSEEAEAAGLLRPHLPEWLSSTLNWSTLTLQYRSYVDEELAASESDLLFEVQRQAGAGEALRRHVPGPGGDMKTYAEELLQEGRQEGQLGTIENFLRAGIEWSVIKEATGIDQEAFQALRRRLGESDRTTE